MNAQSKNPVTLVSALYRTNREEIDGRSWDDYLSWFDKTLELNCPMVLFVPEELQDFIEQRRNARDTKVFIESFEEAPYYFLKDQIDQIITSEKYKQEIQDPQRIECRVSWYNIIQYSKFKWLQRVAEDNPFSSDFFFWLDSGASRFFNGVDPSLPYPHKDTLEFLHKKQELFFMQYNIDSPLHRLIEISILGREYISYSHAFIPGAHFGGSRIAVNNVESAVNEILMNRMIQQGTINNEQIALGLLYLEKSELFCALNRKNRKNPIDLLVQFATPQKEFQEVEKRKIHIAIIGPGIMPIPPEGWGAVETLIWDIKLGLESLGLTVHIINNPSRRETLKEIQSINPDFVYIEYDDAIDIYPYINKPKAITTHYGYLEQKEKYGSYQTIFDAFRDFKPNVFCLSREIKQVYLKSGNIPEAKLFVTPNGVQLENFAYTEHPDYPDRSLYLAKIDYRKRQHLFQSISSLYYAGNCVDDRFDAEKNYLGEWTKEHLYKNLTHYGNLVLLSDGEAHPLVCMEAFAAGLGVVISEWATANLDTSKPFITVINEEDITNIALIEERIIGNRQYSIAHREEILAYAQGFCWKKVLEEQYIPAIKALIRDWKPEKTIKYRAGKNAVFSRKSFWRYGIKLSKKLGVFEMLKPSAKLVKRIFL